MVFEITNHVSVTDHGSLRTLIRHSPLKLSTISLKLFLPISDTISFVASAQNRNGSVGARSRITTACPQLTDDDSEQREKEELGDDEESEVASDDGSVETRARDGALVARQVAHNDGLHPSEEGSDGRRQDTRYDGERRMATVRPVVEEGDIGRQLQRSQNRFPFLDKDNKVSQKPS